MSIALHKAFSKLLADEFGGSGGVKGLRISESQITDCLHDYSIEREKLSENVYIAELSYRFDRKLVLHLLEKYGIDCVIVEKENAKKEVKIIVYIGDFLANYGEFKKIGCSIKRFSGEKIIFAIDSKRFNDFKNIGVRYATRS
jgi:hypothetical protein